MDAFSLKSMGPEVCPNNERLTDIRDMHTCRHAEAPCCEAYVPSPHARHVFVGCPAAARNLPAAHEEQAEELAAS